MSVLLTDPRYWDSKSEHQIAYWQYMDKLASPKADYIPRHLNTEGSEDRDRPFWIWTLWTLVLSGLAMMTVACFIAYATGSGAALLWVVVACVLLYIGAQVWERIVRVDDVDVDDLPLLAS